MKRTLCWFLCLSITAVRVHAQTPDSLISALKTINAATTAAGAWPVSNRAMNIYLSNKIGYALSAPDDLSLYKNSVLVNAATGVVSIDHNLYQPKGIDSRVRTFTDIGVQLNAADAYNAALAHRSFDNRLGFVVKQTFIGKGRSTFSTPQQKLVMDALRAAILHDLITQIHQKTAAFESALSAFDTAADIPGQDTATARNIARRQFYAGLNEEYSYQYAWQQSQLLAKTLNYRLITLDWTIVSLYIPLLTENFPVTTTKPDSSATRHAWPIDLNVSHTRLWESVRWGRLYLTATGELRSDIHFTPALKGALVYFPPTSHFGLSGRIEQNFGPWHALNGIIGVPIVLINKKAEPACNFEVQLRFYGRTSVGLTMGVPFSKIAF